MEKVKLVKSDISTERIARWRADGKKALGIVCCHTPFELLHAADVLPVRLRGSGCKNCADSEACMGNENCGFTKAMLQYLIDSVYDLDGIVSSNGCMTAMGVYSGWKSISTKNGKDQFLYELIAPTMENDAAFKFFKGELEELAEYLEKFTGITLTNARLKKSADTYNEARRLVKQLYDLHKAEHPVISGADTLKLTLAATEMPIEEYIDFLKLKLAELEKCPPITDFQARVMLIGSALDDPEYVKAIEDTGLLVVADLNSFGLRFLRDELVYDENDVFDSIARYYLTRASCPRMLDGSDTTHLYVLGAAEDYAVEGVIIERLKHCAKWEGETMVLEQVFKERDIPCLALEREVQMEAAGQFSIRVEAFREMLESRRGE